ncbi:hypothetical protein D8S78_15275 [Natrialba swarupiae]|nr:hypothetical protein [Natrialba swarupiae]
MVPTDDGWLAIVEVVERRSVPDTQDIIGRYEVELDDDVTVHGYRRLDRYRRGIRPPSSSVLALASEKPSRYRTGRVDVGRTASASASSPATVNW